MLSPMLAYLLDKSVVRRVVEGLTHPDRLIDEEATAIALWRAFRESRNRMFISAETANIMGRFSTWREVRLFLDTVETMYAGKYFKRWTRRLREYGFTREDAKVLGLATYGTDAAGEILGVEVVVTFDRPLINNYEARRPALQRRLQAMTAQLSQPFRDAGLPEVMHPIEGLLSLE
jgi:hypothetical protein